MANRDQHYRPPDLRGLAHRQLIDPAEMTTDEGDGFIEAWPAETAEVELVPTTTEPDAAEIPIVSPLGPPPARRAVPVLSASQARAERRRSSRWVGNLVLVAVALGLLGGIAFALGAVWFIEPAGTERWFARATEWIGVAAAPPSDEDDERDLRLPVPRPVAPGLAVQPRAPDARLEGAMQSDEAAFVEAEEPPDAPLEEEPLEVAAPAPPPRPRPRPRPLPRPRVVVPLPAPTVRPYEERPKPAPVAPAPAPTDERGLIIER